MRIAYAMKHHARIQEKAQNITTNNTLTIIEIHRLIIATVVAKKKIIRSNDSRRIFVIFCYVNFLRDEFID